MRSLPLLAIALWLSTPELAAQNRGRRGGPPPGAEAPPPAAEPAPAKTDAPAKPKRYQAIVGGDVYLGTGARLAGATVLLADDKIEAVGHNLDLPEGTVVHDAKGKTVCPGFVAVLGTGMGAPRSAPFVDGVNPFDPEIKQGLAAGVTAFLAGSPGGGAMPTGGNAVVKLAYGSVAEMVVQEDSVVGMTVPLSLADREKFTETVQKARDYLQALEDFPKKKAADAKAAEPAMPQGAEKVVAILRGKARLWVSVGSGSFNPFGGGGRRGGGGSKANDVDGIRQALELSRLLGKGVVLQKPTSAWLVPDEVAATGSMAILSPRDRLPADPTDPDRTGSNLASAAILAAAGVPIAVTCPQGLMAGVGVGTGGIMGQDLNTPHLDAAFAVRGGLDNRKALRTITLDAARMIGAEHRIGSLEPGKDADVLILDGDPLHYATFVTTAIVNGKVVYEKDREPLYNHITR
jgi:hypothetical protein